MFGFLKKKSPLRLTQEEAGELIDLVGTFAIKMVREMNPPEGWSLRAKNHMQAEFACFVIHAATRWHEAKAAQIGNDFRLLSIYRGDIEQKISALAGYSALKGKPASDIVDNRAQIYADAAHKAGDNLTEHWSDIFAHLAIYGKDQYELKVYPNCHSRGDVYSMLMEKRIMPNPLEIYHLKVHFSEAMRHKFPVQLETFKTLHGARMEKVIE